MKALDLNGTGLIEQDEFLKMLFYYNTLSKTSKSIYEMVNKFNVKIKEENYPSTGEWICVDCDMNNEWAENPKVCTMCGFPNPWFTKEFAEGLLGSTAKMLK